MSRAMIAKLMSAATAPQKISLLNIGFILFAMAIMLSGVAFGQTFKGVTANGVTIGTPPGGSVQPTLTSLSRAVGSAAGGTTLTATGTSFVNGATFTLCGAAATVAFVNSTTLNLTSGTHAATNAQNCSAVVTNPGGLSSTLTNAYDYESASSTTYFSVNFEDGTLGILKGLGDGQGGQVPVVQTTFHATGTHAAQTTCTSGGTGCSTSRLDFGFCDGTGFSQGNVTPCNPAASNATGLYYHFWILPDAACNTALLTPGKQVKMTLQRFANGASYPFTQTGEGDAIFGGGSNHLGDEPDSGLITPQNPLFTYTFDGSTWAEVEIHMVRNTSTHLGRYDIWVNGKMWKSEPFNSGIGSDDVSGAAKTVLQAGVVVSELGTTAFNIYVDDVSAADGWIEP